MANPGRFGMGRQRANGRRLERGIKKTPLAQEGKAAKGDKEKSHMKKAYLECRSINLVAQGAFAQKWYLFSFS
ncbi:hypothetical protein [Desulfobulbus sp.]|uniref:hypothetical protein n=1 Tax=Desulfobulbus sp. TaxID=895 RepID=UPI00286F8D07|nr:hypothetical protein [Desulfobulbus sp.]